jgi:hypothetical protein
MSLIHRLRDSLGRFTKATNNPMTQEELSTSKELVTKISTEILINGKPIDLTNLQKEDAVVLYNFGILKQEHFNAICKLEGWRFEEELKYEEE